MQQEFGTQRIGTVGPIAEMVQQRHPAVAAQVKSGFSSHSEELKGCAAASNKLGALDLKMPTGEQFRPHHNSQGEREPGEPRHGWQKVAAEGVHNCHREQVSPLCRHHNAHCCFPRAAHWLQSNLRLSPSIPDRFRALPSPVVAAPLAPMTFCSTHLLVVSTLLAITEQRARQQGFWAGGAMQSRMPSLRCAGKRAHVSR